MIKIKAEQEKEREIILQQEKLKKLEEEEERVRKEKFEEEERLKEEEKKMKEWERKFDEEQRIKEDQLIENFYKDPSDDKKILESTKSDNELNNNEIDHEKPITDGNSLEINEDDKK